MEHPTLLTPATPMTPADQPPQAIHGVSLYNKAGKLKSNYSNAERLKILGATPGDLDDFIELFCPGKPHYAITRAKTTDPRDWTTPKGRISETEILNHLLGNLLPGKQPRWVAPRSWEVTRWVGIDVDLRNDDYADFFRRCKQLRQAMKRLGILNKHLLVSKTPSGGNHYRFFLTHKIRVWEIENVFRNVGIEECSGKFELFPREKKGMRLPFGYVPGKPFRPQAWLAFIRQYRNAKLPLVNWQVCAAKSQRFQALNNASASPKSPTCESSSPPPKTPKSNLLSKPVRKCLGIPKRIRLQTSATSTTNQDEYFDLLSKGPGDFTAADASRIWELGILAPGTRVNATQKMAWHLCHYRGYSCEEATQMLVTWVYQTGKSTSQEVRQDLAEKTRKAEQQTREIVSWVFQHPPTQPQQTAKHTLFSATEVDYLLSQLPIADREHREELWEFALNFLRYAKLHGEATSQGWEVSITAAKVMRKWPRSSGSKYKVKRDRLEELGLVAVTRKEWKTRNRGGRARTYLIKVKPALSIAAKLTTQEALVYAREKTSHESSRPKVAERKWTPNDSYKRVERTTLSENYTEEGDSINSIQEDQVDRKYGSEKTRIKQVLYQVPASDIKYPVKSDNTLKPIPGSFEEWLLINHPAIPPADLSETSPPVSSRLDLRRLMELGLSQKEIDALVSRPSYLGIPKATKLKMERVTRAAFQDDLLPFSVLTDEPCSPASRSSDPHLNTSDQGAIHAQPQPGYP